MVAISLLPQPLSTESAESAGPSKNSPRARNNVTPYPDSAAGTSRARDSRACPELSVPCPELVEGACPEHVEGACPELVEGSNSPPKNQNPKTSYYLLPARP